ncbi:MAG TPA: heparin lyase I family protein [Solirubrobacterales bacterium]|nr:heparin lyase I family protein [Solirubrobacterales bacterium]
MRWSIATGAVFAILLAFALTADVAAARPVKIVAPRAVRAPRNARFAVRVSAPARRVAFFVDNRRRWVSRSDRWRFNRRGRLRTKRMAPGRHRLWIRAKLSNGRVVSARRILYVAKKSSTHGHKGTETALSEATPTETTSSGTTSSSSGLLFSGSRISDFPTTLAAPGAITETPDPAGGSGTAIDMTVKESDGSFFEDGKPRAQLQSPPIIEPGDEFWWHSRFFLPADFPSYVSHWINIMEGPYGPPYNGTPPWEIGMDQGSDLRWQRNGSYNWDIPWSMPLVRNRWVDVLLHERFGTDGWIEMWIDGQQVTFFGSSNTVAYNPNHESPTQRLNMKTMDASNNGGPNFAVIQNYRGVGWIESVSVYHGPMELGTTRASVGG